MEAKKAEKNGKTTVKELLETAVYSQGFCDGLEYMYDLLKEETK